MQFPRLHKAGVIQLTKDQSDTTRSDTKVLTTNRTQMRLQRPDQTRADVFLLANPTLGVTAMPAPSCSRDIHQGDG